MTNDAPQTDGERLVRIETKLDVVVGAHGAQLGDHETRLRIQEARKTISPRELWLAVTGGAGGVLAAIQLLNLLLK